MTFSRVNTLGWALFENLTSAQMNALDLDHSRAVDGNAGGAYAPSSPIALSGSALTLAANTTAVWQASAWPGLTSRSILIAQPLVIVSRTQISTPPTRDFTGNDGRLQQTYVDTGAGSDPDCIVDLPNLIRGATLNGVHMWINPACTTAAARRAKMQVFRYPTNSESRTSLIGPTEDPLTGASYVAEHLFELTGINETISETSGSRYCLKITGEGGANAVAIYISNLWASFTLTKIVP